MRICSSRASRSTCVNAGYAEHADFGVENALGAVMVKASAAVYGCLRKVVGRQRDCACDGVVHWERLGVT